MENSIISEGYVQTIISDISNEFPACAAAVFSDRHGFLIASQINFKDIFNEEMLAIQSVTKRKLVNFKGYSKFHRKISKDVNLFIVAKKNVQNLAKFRKLKKGILKKISL
jgi:hypothetical protein